MESENIILRGTDHAPLVNKADFLTSDDFDNNFIAVYDDLVSLCKTLGVDEYDSSQEYDDTIKNFSVFGNKLYQWINTSPGTGVTPGTEGAAEYWFEVFPSILAHRKNSDTILDEGGANEVTAAEIRAYIDGGLTTTTNLSISTQTASSLKIESSTGTDVTLVGATEDEAGLLEATDKVKLKMLSGENSGDQTLGDLGAEATANKVTDFSVIDDITFPTTQAVETQIAAATTGYLSRKEDLSNKQDALTVDGTGVKYPTVDAVNTGLSGKENSLPSKVSNALKYLQVDAGETGLQWTTVPGSNLGNSDLTSSANARVFNLNGNTSSNYLQFKNQGGTNVLKIQGDGIVYANGRGGVSSNTAFGNNILSTSISGGQNVVIGDDIMQGGTTASQNVCVGVQALYANVTGSANTGIGYQSLAFNTASSNTAVGHSSLRLNSSGANNSSFGNNSLASNTTSSDLTAFGSEALQGSTGSGNSSFGRQSSYSVTTGTGNVAFGKLALYGITTGSDNIHIGKLAGVLGITSGSYNTLIGSGISGLSNVSNNVILADGQGNKVLHFDSVNALISNIKIDTTTGVKIGTATGQKIGFWDATPVIQPTTSVASATLISNLGTPLTNTDTIDGYTVQQFMRAVRNTGLLA